MVNKSKFIDTKKCVTCGKCCKTFSLCYPKNCENIMLSEVVRFNLLDTDLIQVIEKANVFLVKFNFPCKHLKCKKGIYSCEIYDGGVRPKLCEEYPYENTTDCPNMEIKND